MHYYTILTSSLLILIGVEEARSGVPSRERSGLPWHHHPCMDPGQNPAGTARWESGSNPRNFNRPPLPLFVPNLPPCDDIHKDDNFGGDHYFNQPTISRPRPDRPPGDEIFGGNSNFNGRPSLSRPIRPGTEDKDLSGNGNSNRPPQSRPNRPDSNFDEFTNYNRPSFPSRPSRPGVNNNDFNFNGDTDFDRPNSQSRPSRPENDNADFGGNADFDRPTSQSRPNYESSDSNSNSDFDRPTAQSRPNRTDSNNNDFGENSDFNRPSSFRPRPDWSGNDDGDFGIPDWVFGNEESSNKPPESPESDVDDVDLDLDRQKPLKPKPSTKKPGATRRPTTSRPATRRTTTTPIPATGVATPPCTCFTSPEYNPICGTNNITYNNPKALECERNCNRIPGGVTIDYHAACIERPKVGF